MNRRTRNALIIFAVIMLVMFILAGYGWWTGAWWEQ
jgi:hypothetical protein